MRLALRESCIDEPKAAVLEDDDDAPDKAKAANLSDNDALDVEAAALTELGAAGLPTFCALLANWDQAPGMLSFDSNESDLSDKELMHPMQAYIARDTRDEDYQWMKVTEKLTRTVSVQHLMAVTEVAVNNACWTMPWTRQDHATENSELPIVGEDFELPYVGENS